MTSCYMDIPKAAGNVTLESASSKDRPQGGSNASKGANLPSGPKNVRGYQEEADLSDFLGGGSASQGPPKNVQQSLYMSPPK